MKIYLYLIVVVASSFSPDAISDTGTGSVSETADDSSLILETGVSWKNNSLEDLYYYSLAYKRPSSLFGMPTQLSIEVGGLSGRRCSAVSCTGEEANNAGAHLNEFDTPLAGISQEIKLFDHRYFDISFSLGGYLKKPSSRVGSTFTFGERLAINSHISNYHFSAFIRHFSNASMTSDNSGHNFVGLSLSGKF